LSFLRHNAVLVVIVSVHAVALFAVVNTDYVSFTEQFPQQVSAFVSVASGNVSTAAIAFLPAGPGSFEDAFARTLETLAESFEEETSEASKKNGFRPLTKTCDTPATRGEGLFQRYDLASYSLQGSGACVLRFAALERELAELTASSAIATEVRVTTGASRLVSGNARAVPITVDFKGMTRWVIAVDSRCAKRVAFAQGQDAEKEDAEADADEEKTRKNKRASPPVGPWRSTSRGRAGTGTGTLRYAAFGVGGRDARLNPRPITVWIETHDDISQFSLSGDEKNGTSVSEKCARDAMRIRADADFETAIAMATRNASPAWVVPFAKHHTPLKLAVLAVAGLEQKRSDA
jgi:hypothetical protein